MFDAIRKVLTAGSRLPEELQAQLDAEGLIYTSRVAVIRRFSGAVPGLRSGASISRTKGTLAFTSQRVIATLASRADPWQRIVDCRWDSAVSGPLKVEISRTGVQIDLDVAHVDSTFQGHLSLHYKTTLADDVLILMPKTALAQGIGADDVSRALGVRPRS